MASGKIAKMDNDKKTKSHCSSRQNINSKNENCL